MTLIGLLGNLSSSSSLNPFSFSSSVGGGKGSWELNFMIFVKIGCCPLDCCYLYNIVNLPEKEYELKEKMVGPPIIRT